MKPRLWKLGLLACWMVCAASQVTAALTHRYTFETDARDSVGDAHGQLVNGATVSGGALVLNGSSQYLNLPNGLLSNHHSITIEVWITDNGSGTWSRIYDFGSSSAGEDFPIGTSGTTGTRYMFLTPRSGSGTLRGAHTVTGGGAGEQIVEWSGTALPSGVMKHVLWVYDAATLTVRLYVDGQVVGINELVTIKPSDCEPTVNNWIGRSQFSADAFLNARIHEFRIYDEALSPFQVALNYNVGPDVILTNAGSPQALRLSGPAQLVLGGSASLNLRADFSSVTNVNITSVPGVVYRSSDTNVLVVSAAGLVTAVDSGEAELTAQYQGLVSTWRIMVQQPPQTLRHRYSFTTDATDAVGGANGVLLGGPVISNGAVRLNGVNQYVDLPNNMFMTFTSITFEAWATDFGSGGWARLWDFGNSSGGEGNQGGGTSYMFLAWPYGGGGGIRGAYKTAAGAEQILNITPQPPIGVRQHIVWTQDAASQTARLYVNGVLRGVNSSFTYTPAAIGATFNNWLGRSQYNDPWFNGSIDEFRVYDVAITEAEVQQNYLLGPEVSPQSGPVTITTAPSNTTVNEGQPVTFRVAYVGQRPIRVQWYRDGVAIPGATNLSLRLAQTRPQDDGAVFSVALTNVVLGTTYGVASSGAVLRVVTDTAPPQVVRAFNVGSNEVRLVFSEPLAAATATNAANYAFTNGLAVQSARLSEDGLTVSLGTAGLNYGVTYTLTLQGISDRASTPNVLASGTTVTFLASPYAPLDIGGAQPASYQIAQPSGYQVSGAGEGAGGTADQFGFQYRLVSGDFDVRVQVTRLEGGDLWAQAGLMARESLEANSVFAATFTSPGAVGQYFQYRQGMGLRSVSSGSVPPNYPHVWLRLQRVGNEFHGYTSADGQTWSRLGSVTLNVGPAMYLGMAVASHVNGALATAEFAALGDNPSQLVAPLVQPGEPLGPSSRRTGLVISEIMYRPAPRADGKNLEYVEIYNSNPFFHDLSGYRLSGDISYTFPAGTKLPGGGFLVVAANPGQVSEVYGLPQVYGPYTNTLRTSGTLRLRDEQDAILLEIQYRNTHPWPMAADGTGHSIVLARPSYGENDPRAWDISDVIGGSPGRLETYRPSPLRDVVINEILANAGAGEDYVELYNHSRQTNDLSGCILTDTPANNKFRIPQGTLIPPGGKLVFYQSQLGFGLKAGGDTIYFKNPQATRVLDAVRFEAQAEGVAYGRWPDGAREFYLLGEKTPGQANSAPRPSPVVINEIMYHPLSENDDDQYVELHNPGQAAVNLGGWQFVDGIRYTFPPDTLIPAGGYLVVARNRTNLLAKYPGLSGSVVVGDFEGRLARNGERLALAQPWVNITTNNQGRTETNLLMVVVEEVTYADGGRWGQWSDGGGSSLELRDPRANRRLAFNWADSDETQKAPWTTIAVVDGMLDNGSSYNNEAIAFFQVGQLGAGECLVDNFEVLRTGSTQNFALNPDFESGMTNWAVYGCFVRSHLAPGQGVGGGNALRLRTHNRFFTLANHAEGAMTSGALAAGNTATLRFQARWLRGCPDIIMRLRGNWLEAAGRMIVPSNLGTPGAPNSRLTTNAAPAIYAVTHQPALPAAGEPVRVIARLEDPDGVTGALRYRLDNQSSYTEVPLRDDGTQGDEVAGDGIYSALIPGQAAGVTVAFVVVAQDGGGVQGRFPELLDDNSPARECVVRWGEPQPASAFGTYHLWLTASNVTRWVTLPVLSNEDIDGTLVYNGRVIYNMGARYAGSPYHQAFDGPAGTRACHYTWQMPSDDKLLGHASFNKIHWIGNDIQDDNANANINDSTLQREQVANELLRGLGLPWVYRRYVMVYVNGVRRGQLMEDALRPSVSVPDSYFPDDEGGYLYKIQPWFEGGAPSTGNNANTPWQNKEWASLRPFTTTGGAYKLARYRWNYQVRETADNNNNYTNVFNLITAANAYNSPTYVSNMMKVANMENWLRLVAANHAAGNWDCFGIQNQQNVYGYVSPNVPWTLFMFDFSIVLGNRISWGPAQNLEYVVPGSGSFAADPAWQRIYSNPTANPSNPGNPTFRRMYWRALKELALRVMQPQNIEALMDARYAAFRASGLAATTPQPIKDWIASARDGIAAQAAAFDTTQFGPTATTQSFSTNSVVLNGKAPLEVATIEVNGIAYPVTWTTMTDWSLRLALPQGTNTIRITGRDYFGNAITSAVSEVRLVVTQPTESPEGKVVFSEIMANPAVPDAEYVELFNTSSNTTFDLSGWRINGLSYVFPGGSLIPPRGYLVVAKNRNAYYAAYGANAPLHDVFNGNLQSGGETLTLLRPGVEAGSEVVVNRVRYESEAPWAPATNGMALQLLDVQQDNRRVSNWGVPSSGWRYVSYTGTNLIGTAQLVMYLNGLGEVYLDDVKLVEGFVAEQGTNLLVNGDFELPLTNGWTLPLSNQIAELSTTLVRSGQYSVRLRATHAQVVVNNTSLKQAFSPGLPTGRPYTLSYWYYPLPGNPNFTTRLQPGTMNYTHSAAPPPGATPGTSNSVSAVMPPYPEIWLNEIQPENTAGAVDGAGRREPWVEIYNGGTNAVSLAGWILASSYTNLTEWPFPADAFIQPGEFLVVWLDGQPGRTTGREYHASFRPTPGTGTLALARLVNAAPQVVDYLNYRGVPASCSYGSVPDGQPFYRQVMQIATAGTNNTGAAAPLTVFINEWMAGNQNFLAEPVTGLYDDWFELYNPGPAAANLGGYYLSDRLTNPFMFRIPEGWVIPPGGFLLVWADNNPALNSNRTHLHVNFRLNLDGEAIGLFTPEGAPVDTVVFGRQTNDVSEGRFPDGAATRYFMVSPTPGAPNRLGAPSAPPQLVSPVVNPVTRTLSFQFQTVPGRQYRLEYKDSLAPAVPWQVQTNYTGSGQPVTVTVGTTNAPQRYYRLGTGP
ncbi:MAG: lamin tail domain-containing protein [Verrucomicrobiae bacterium]|nr:lamin tail domain-containing protein [Verrucomicrobiae bacterium]